ncbi:MAG: BON domain-containing protein [Pyrinomonadaceae bacterium MAG19_C2-C3]|nr:BON domain-containing protein [Pyrinomonadaceae bacterium MAG19_C2-C3]
MKNITTITLGVALATLLTACSRTETTTTTNTNRAVNANGNAVTTTTTTTRNSNGVTREEFDRDRARYETEARTAGRTIGSGANDLWIFTKTRAALLATDDLRQSTVNVDVDNNVVTLTGTIESAAQSNRATLVAQGIEGVTRVNNQLKVQPGDSITNTNMTTNGNMNNRNR